MARPKITPSRQRLHISSAHQPTTPRQQRLPQLPPREEEEEAEQEPLEAAHAGKSTLTTAVWPRHRDLVEEASKKMGFPSRADYIRYVMLHTASHDLGLEPPDLEAEYAAANRGLLAQAAALLGEDPKALQARWIREASERILEEAARREAPKGRSPKSRKS